MANCTLKTKIFVGGRIIGVVEGNIFRKTVSASRHFLHSPRAIALDVESLSDAELAGARIVEVRDRETGRIYRAPIASIREHGIPINRGYGIQLALLLDDWKRSDQSIQPAFWS